MRIKEAIQRLRVGDHDVVVVTCNAPMALEHAERIRVLIRKTLRKVGKKAEVVVLSENVTLSILETSRLPDDDPPPPPPDHLYRIA